MMHRLISPVNVTFYYHVFDRIIAGRGCGSFLSPPTTAVVDFSRSQAVVKAANPVSPMVLTNIEAAESS